AEPAGRGPNSTCFFTCPNARSESKAVVIFFDSLPVAGGVGEPATEGFTGAELSVHAMMKPMIRRKNKRTILIVKCRKGAWIVNESSNTEITSAAIGNFIDY